MSTRIFYAALFLVTLVVSHLLIEYFAMSSFNVLRVKGTFTPETKLFFSSSNGLYPVSEKTAIGSGVQASDQEQILDFQLGNRLINSFRIDIHHMDSSFEIDRIVLYSHFSRGRTAWYKKQLNSDFSRQESAQGTVTSLIHPGPVRGQNFFVEWVVPILIALLVCLVLGQANWRELPSVLDFNNSHAIRSQDNFNTLDGVRGLAALLVLLHHGTVTFQGYGTFGVWIFFALSGFLLTKPFVLQPDTASKPGVLASFMRRRFNRIVPMYYFMITCIFLLPNHFDTAVRHYLFVQGDGHFWTILQEMYFYLLLPLVTLLAYLLWKARPMTTIVILCIAAVAWSHLGTVKVLSIYGLNEPLRAYFEIFLLGMAGAYWYHGIYVNQPRLRSFCSKHQKLITIVALIVLALTLDIYREAGLLGSNFQMKKHSLVGAIVSIVLILLAVVGTQECWYKKILASPFLRYIGIIGYSFYLIHPYSIFMIKHGIEHYFDVPSENVSEVWRVTAALILTTVFASFTYSFIERPFLQRKT